MKNRLYLILVIWSLAISGARAQTYIREQTCMLTETDNINTCRTIMLDRAKTELSQEINRDIRQKIKVTQNGSNDSFTNEDVEAIITGLIKSSIMEEKLDGKTYSMKAKLEADNEWILNAIKKLRQTNSEESDKYHETLIANYRALKLAREEIAQLKNQITQTDNQAKKEKLVSSYIGQIKKIALYNLVDRGYHYYQKGQYDAAAFFFRKAAEQGYTLGQSNLKLMQHNCSGIKQDDKPAIQACIQSAEQGDAEGQLNLGFMYLNGHGVEQDDSQAIRWFNRSAEQDYAKAQYTLGILYYEGRIVKRDNLTAVYWFRKAAEQGNAQAQSSLGLMYRNGHGVTQDNTQAIHWLNKSAEQGHDTAINALAWNYATCNFGCDSDKAIHWADKLLAISLITQKEAELDTIAAAYARSGKFEKAIEYQEKAISLLSNEKEIAAYRERLELYRTNQPYTDPKLQRKEETSDNDKTVPFPEYYEELNR
ncbi:MAG: sel1 repeat family protein [Gammaproteobacteria bacterium]|nr:sel1 repeat family protein [Gammaproteobacteria bacterium]